ncbi:MAG: hypothetical protein GWN67_16805 [Phycisphaerae bacterium]|nr:hypothetical protein [Phycisphaerae bacterium]NIP53868.1 hypothetical protein [Phycisphaerae bacterium]NIS52817.1 hypothetical protein [Phycisphaerae bacterium]NIU10229.1 hypothetical protein [Phycisphaerae bacterium]NIU57987.1 hypothetical protein [Phycisphaerae bacterium]
MRGLNKREKRTVKFGVVCAVAIIGFAFVTDILGRWKESRSGTDNINKQLKAINVKETERARLMSIVPVFEMPEKEEIQKFLFRDKFNEQLKKARIKSEPLQIVPASKSPVAGYELLRLKCSAKCKFGQALDLLANLKDNPYLVGIEEFKIECDQKKRQDVKLNITISTFVK